MRTIFEYSEQSASYLPPCDVPELELEGSAARKLPLSLPNVSETTLCRHYSALPAAPTASTAAFIRWVPAR